MTIKTKIGFDESSKAVTAQIVIESEELKPEEVLKLAVEIALKAQDEAKIMTLRKL